ncbi:putative quinol monooxygenase [Ochrobactrum sp. RH2CCR150]|uniref:putative quinol monooxygenase n=1 Tax=Ochrobactrum sp. RH2CCR150 TaxID=2587044 RepID=UPI0015FDBF0E|nr:quinol monooxygenase YgiN [Ochrobactrum sp. RH2CCR150]URQ74878.1 MAG: antibiotic biosynthesis monooxygenase [Candidatus Ochrobactrum gambitense]WEK16326.1 MAG: putative quinol monooxygenase [Candidatus Ochrobactrum gambitense]
MITLNVFFHVREESKKEFLSVLNNMVSESNKEAGCDYYQLWKSADESNIYALIENWTDRESLALHQKTPHWIAFNDVVNSFLVRPYDENHYTAVPH